MCVTVRFLLSFVFVTKPVCHTKDMGDSSESVSTSQLLVECPDISRSAWFRCSSTRFLTSVVSVALVASELRRRFRGPKRHVKQEKGLLMFGMKTRTSRGPLLGQFEFLGRFRLGSLCSAFGTAIRVVFFESKDLIFIQFMLFSVVNVVLVGRVIVVGRGALAGRSGGSSNFGKGKARSIDKDRWHDRCIYCRATNVECRSRTSEPHDCIPKKREVLVNFYTYVDLIELLDQHRISNWTTRRLSRVYQDL